MLWYQMMQGGSTRIQARCSARGELFCLSLQKGSFRGQVKVNLHDIINSGLFRLALPGVTCASPSSGLTRASLPLWPLVWVPKLGVALGVLSPFEGPGQYF